MINRNLFGKFLLLAVLALPFQQACTNLDEKAFSDLTDDVFPKTEEQLISVAGAAYTSLYFFAGHNSIMSLQEVSSDEIMIPQRGNDWFDGGQWLRVHRHETRPTEESINNGWNSIYGGISTCNRVIDLFKELLDAGTLDATLGNNFIAELRGVRALYYYWLLDAYGNVPIVESFATAGASPATKPRAEVYTFVENELTEILPLLSKDKNTATYARFTYWPAKALQAKLYLNAQTYVGKNEYAKCVTACDEIINSGLYSLESDYFTNFNYNNGGSAENIFVIPYDNTNAGGFVLSQMTLHYGSQATFSLKSQPWNGYCTLQEFYESYDDSDKRKGKYGDQKTRGNFHAGPQYAADGSTPIIDGSAEANDPDGQGLVFTPEINEHFPGCLRQTGARVGKYEYKPNINENMDNDFPILRYGDVILMKAEALMRQAAPDVAGATALVNQIRGRAGMDDLSTLDLNELLAERGREMFYEGWRRQDLIRFGKFNGTWAFKPASEPTKNIFPIPANQISANPNLVQNPGY